MTTPVLELTEVSKQFVRGRTPVNALADLSLSVHAGESVGLIGESGSGKSTAGRIAVGLISPTGGDVRFMGRSIVHATRSEMKVIRPQLQMVFQEPYESLNPRMTVQSIVGEPLLLHERSLSKRERLDKVVATLELVGLGAGIIGRFPRDLSGGQQQRVGIARAAVTRPKLIVLDEPTSSLDLSVRAITLSLLRDLQDTLGLAYLFISHDISTVSNFCSRVVVLRGGHLIEQGSTEQVLTAPNDDYTRELLAANLSTTPAQRK